MEFKNRNRALEGELMKSHHEIEKMKQINRELLEQLSLYQASSMNSISVLKGNQTNNEATKIHRMYQDLYLTDMKKDLDVVEFELKN